MQVLPVTVQLGLVSLTCWERSHVVCELLRHAARNRPFPSLSAAPMLFSLKTSKGSLLSGHPIKLVVASTLGSPVVR